MPPPPGSIGCVLLGVADARTRRCWSRIGADIFRVLPSARHRPFRLIDILIRLYLRHGPDRPTRNGHLQPHSEHTCKAARSRDCSLDGCVVTALALGCVSESTGDATERRPTPGIKAGRERKRRIGDPRRGAGIRRAAARLIRSRSTSWSAKVPPVRLIGVPRDRDVSAHRRPGRSRPRPIGSVGYGMVGFGRFGFGSFGPGFLGSLGSFGSTGRRFGSNGPYGAFGLVGVVRRVIPGDRPVCLFAPDGASRSRRGRSPRLLGFAGVGVVQADAPGSPTCWPVRRRGRKPSASVSASSSQRQARRSVPRPTPSCHPFRTEPRPEVKPSNRGRRPGAAGVRRIRCRLRCQGCFAGS